MKWSRKYYKENAEMLEYLASSDHFIEKKHGHVEYTFTGTLEIATF